MALVGDSINMFFWNELHIAIDPPPSGVGLEHSAAVTGTRNCLAVFMYIRKNYRTEWERCSSLIINMCTVCHTTGSLFSSQTCLIEIKNWYYMLSQIRCVTAELSLMAKHRDRVLRFFKLYHWPLEKQREMYIWNFTSIFELMSEDLKSSWYQIPGNREKFNTSRSISNSY